MTFCGRSRFGGDIRSFISVGRIWRQKTAGNRNFGDKMIRGHAWLTKVIPGTYLKVKRIEIKELKVTQVLGIAKEMLIS